MERLALRATTLGLLVAFLLLGHGVTAQRRSKSPPPNAPLPPRRRNRSPPPDFPQAPRLQNFPPSPAPPRSPIRSTPPSPNSPPPRPPPPFPPAPPARQPNFVVILVDDQDYLLNSTHRAFMPKLHQYIGDRGLHLNNFIVTSSLCCPSRVSLLTGRYTHNHNVTSNQDPQGYTKFAALQLDNDYLPTWLKPLGYNTYFTGKFINLFDVAVGDTRSCPKSWDMFDPLTDKTVYNYIDYDFMPQCARLDSFRNAYQTDTITDRSLGYIDTAVAANKPFYLQINPAACHTSCPKGNEDGGSCVPPIPAPKYAGRFSDMTVPRSSNWNLPLPNILNIGPDENVGAAGIDRHYQRRLETMLSVDDLIEAVVTKLEARGVLDNTYVIYVSDNGYHLGNHGLPKGKTLPYEEDIRVPFYMRGPGIPEGVVSPYMATMVDLSSTLVQLGGGTPPDRIDGVPLPLERILPGAVPRAAYPVTNGTLRQMLPVEMWINSLSKDLDNKDYRGVRICTSYTLNASLPTICWKYTIWCVWPTTTNYKELFDLNNDPGEIRNLLPISDSNPQAENFRRLINRLDALLQVMGYCRGASCRRPWARLHPEGGVDSLEAAMNPVYDAKYAAYTKYAWRSCRPFYDPVNNEVADPALGGVSRWVNATSSG